MPSMDVSLDLGRGKDFSSEVVLSIDFRVTSGGCSAHYGSLSYAGHPAEAAEIEIEMIFWPVKRWDAEKKAFIDDHIEFPYGALPSEVAEGIEAYIVEHYDPADYYDPPEPDDY